MKSVTYLVFTDASFDPKARCGIGGYLAIPEQESPRLNDLDACTVETRRIDDTNCVRLELLAILWAVEDIRRNFSGSLKIFTDCQTAVGLPARRSELELRSFLSRRSQRPLKNADLYRAFYEMLDREAPQIYFVKGHKPRDQRGPFDEALSRVDQAVRRRLRGERR